MAKRRAVFAIRGSREIRRVCRELEPRLAKKVIRQAIRKVLKPILAMARELAPIDEGFLKASIKIKAMKRSRRRFGVMVTVSSGDFKGPAFYGSFIEFGTVKIQANPYMRPAFDVHKEWAEAELKKLLIQGLEREVKLLVRKLR